MTDSHQIDLSTLARGSRVPRRNVLAGAGLAAGASALALPARAQTAQTYVPTPANDIQFVNYLLNLEYLQAEYYLRGTIGTGLSPVQTTGSGAQGTVNAPATTLVHFTNPALAYYFTTLAGDENAHVNLLRNLLTANGATPIAEPSIDFVNGFNGFAQLAGLGSSFNPFADQTSFLLGAYIFEDVVVSSYNYHVPGLQPVATAAVSQTFSYLPTLGAMMAAEGYHVGAIRTILADIGGDAITDAISAARSMLSTIPDEGTSYDSNPFNFANTDDYGLTEALAFQQTTSILYGTSDPSVNGGLFFPDGLNIPV